MLFLLFLLLCEMNSIQSSRVWQKGREQIKNANGHHYILNSDIEIGAQADNVRHVHGYS